MLANSEYIVYKLVVVQNNEIFTIISVKMHKKKISKKLKKI